MQKKEPKMRFVAIFWILGPQMDLILHIMVAQNVFEYVTIVRGHA